MRIKLVHITLNMQSGGIENFLVNFASKIDQQKYELTIICLDGGGVLLDKLHFLGCKTILLKRRPGFDWKLILNLIRIFRKERFDIVHTHNLAAHFYGGLAARLCGLPLLTTEHSRHYIDARYIRRYEKLFTSMITDKWIVVNNDLADLSIHSDKVNPEKILLIENGIDIDRFSRKNCNEQYEKERNEVLRELGIPEDSKIIIMVARLHPIKNHKLLFEAVKHIKTRLKNVHVILVGEGSFYKELVDEVGRIGISGQVHFLGYCPDVDRLLMISDVFVLCSETEGLPLSLLEVLAARVPVIITRSSNMAGLIRDRINGRVVNSSKKDIAEALIERFNSDEAAKDFSFCGYMMIKERYSVDKMIKNYDLVYKEVLGIINNSQRRSQTER